MPLERPELPVKHHNPNLNSLTLSKWPAVKYQSLDRDGHEVLVGRLKIPTPTGHAFILRRYDTGAISLTTMFRAAFPDASEADERKEAHWAKEAFDLSGNNGSSREPGIVRLAGTWISPPIALLPQFADAYHLRDVLLHINRATPDPKVTYRRSAATKGTPKAAPPSSPIVGPAKTLLTPAPSMTTPTPKRRRESSPDPAPAPPPTHQSSSSLPPPRRAARTKSPAPFSKPVSVKSPKSVRAARMVRLSVATTPAGSDETVVEEAETIELAKPSMTQDMVEQKELIERLKAERGLQKPGASVSDTALAPVLLKREREDEKNKDTLQFNFKEPETEERQIATNKRVSRFQLEPRTKSAAWGIAAFAIGMGAVSFLPNFF